MSADVIEVCVYMAATAAATLYVINLLWKLKRARQW
jgi:hypothetical protein